MLFKSSVSTFSCQKLSITSRFLIDCSIYPVKVVSTFIEAFQNEYGFPAYLTCLGRLASPLFGPEIENGRVFSLSSYI
jgi:hypothetical protein